MPFSDAGRHVAEAVQSLRDRRLLKRKLALDLRLNEFLRRSIGPPGKKIRDVQPARRLPGHNRRARSRADGRGAIRARKTHPLGGQAVEIWRRLILAPIAGEVVYPQVVAEDEDDIGFRLFGPDGDGEKERQEE